MDDAVLRKGQHFGLPAGNEQRQQPWQVREVADDKNIEDAGLVGRPERLLTQSIPHPGRRVSRLKISGCGERRQRVAGAPECFGRLSRTQLAAVPDHSRFDAAPGGQGRQPIHLRTADERQRSTRVDVRADGVAMVHKGQLHECHNTFGT